MLTSEPLAGIRSGAFANTVLFLTEVLDLEIVSHDKQEEFAQFKLPSGQILELFGPKRIWHPFTTPPDWEVIVADVRFRRQKE
jgi:hypothetical protein